MKCITSLLAFAAAVFAQQNAINIPNGGFQVTAGQPFTITWNDPSSSTVTIKLQQGSNITPETGITLLTGVPASAKTATFTILADEVNVSDYVIEIVDDSDQSDYNFSTNFAIAGASCVGICDGSASSASSSATSTGSSASSTSSSSASTSSAAAAAASSSISSAAASSSAANTASSSGSSRSASATQAAATTSAPSAGGAGAVKAQAGFVIAFVAAVAAF